MLSSRKGGTSDGPEGGTCAASSGASSGATPSMPPPAHLVGDDVELAPALLFNSSLFDLDEADPEQCHELWEVIAPFYDAHGTSKDCAAQLLRDLEDAFVAGNVEQHRRTAHSLRGVASTAGAARLAEAVLAFQAAPSREAFAPMRALLEETQREFARVSGRTQDSPKK